MSGNLEKVSVYHLSGDKIKIMFSRENADELELVYGDEQGTSRHFTGRAIHREKTPLGFLATVVLEEVPDLHVITLSLVVPDANRPENARSIPVNTFAVRTTARTSIAGPQLVEGQIQMYEVFNLEGNAW